MTKTRLAPALAILMAIGCGGDDGPTKADDLRATFEASDAQTVAFCRCAYDDLGYATITACAADFGQLSDAQVDCLVSASELSPYGAAAASCQREATEAWRDCEARSGCSPAVTTACGNAYDADFAACPKACSGLSGSDASSCITKTAAVADASRACL